MAYENTYLKERTPKEEKSPERQNSRFEDFPETPKEFRSRIKHQGPGPDPKLMSSAPQLLFRAKRIDNGRWVYGLPAYSPNGKINRIQSPQGFHHIDPDTICQYISHNNLNDHEIFTNDIVHFHNNLGHFTGIITLKTGYQFPHFEIKWLTKNSCSVPLERFETLGNVFDNPELYADIHTIEVRPTFRELEE